MTSDLDLSPEAVERLDHLSEGLSFALAMGSPKVQMDTEDAHWLISQVRALAAENARLRAERDAAWQAGAEAMRGAAITSVNATAAPVVGTPYSVGGRVFADAIRALPLPGQPKEDAPPLQAPTLDDLLSVATDDEADAIRQAARRANIEVTE